jgi:S-adenosylmethionine:tRNA ribosyltransferase-isomerase
VKLSDFNYNLPNELIATHPAEPRDAARLLVLNKKSEKMLDSSFLNLSEILTENDVLVFNDSKVIPARLKGESNGRSFEVLLVKNVSDSLWECWVRPGKKAKVGELFKFSENLFATLIKREEEIFFFEFNLGGSSFFREVEKIGQMPIPPYILKARVESTDEVVDQEDYQTIFANQPGSVAAPTAGLHFTDELLFKLREKGVQIEKVTLHVGLGTFQPVNTDEVEDFQIHSEYFEIYPETAQRLTEAKAKGKRDIAVGTTTIRVLESAAVDIKSCGFISGCGLNFGLMPKSGETKIYIYPGYQFKFVDAIITNFHLPKSSLMLLVSAFSDKEKILKAYEHAVKEKYRFYSYGDGMFIY